MKQWLRRAIYFLIVTVWLLIMLFPLLAFGLASQGEIRLGKREATYWRVFLIAEDDLGGVGLEYTRPVSSCSQTSITYFLWEGQGVNNRYCLCYDSQDNVISNTAGQCLQP